MDRLTPGPAQIQANHLHKEVCNEVFDDSSDEETDFESFELLMNMFSRNVKSEERVVTEVFSNLSSLTDFFRHIKHSTILIDYLLDPHTSFFSDIHTILDEEPECLEIVISAISKLSSSKQIAESFMENQILEHLYSIWEQLPDINLDILIIFTKLLDISLPLYRPFFIDHDIFQRLIPILQEFNNPDHSFDSISIHLVNAVCVICKFSSAFFNYSTELPIMNSVPIIKTVITVYMNRFKFQDENKDLEAEKRLELCRYSLLTLSRFAHNDLAKCRVLVNYHLYRPLFEDFNSDNEIFFSNNLLILQLIAYMLNSNDNRLKNVTEENLNIHSFHPLLIYKEHDIVAPDIIAECINIFIGLVDIDPAKYGPFLVFYGIINELFDIIRFLPYKEFLYFIVLYYKVLTNNTRESIASNLINESAIDRMVEVSDVEKNEPFVGYLKTIVLQLYEICYKMPSIIEILDAAFDENGILDGVPKPFLL